jgi:hypothetical protein
MIAVVDVVAGECALCRPQLLTPVVRESTHWRIAINRNQHLLGKLFVALRRHEESVAELRSDEWAQLQRELRWLSGWTKPSLRTISTARSSRTRSGTSTCT